MLAMCRKTFITVSCATDFLKGCLNQWNPLMWTKVHCINKKVMSYDDRKCDKKFCGKN